MQRPSVHQPPDQGKGQAGHGKLGMNRIFRPAVWRPRIPAPWESFATVGVGGLPESILSGDDPGISQYCNQKQYINTVITERKEDEILQAIKTMRTGWQRKGLSWSCIPGNRIRFWIICMKRTPLCPGWKSVPECEPDHLCG